MFAVWIRCQIYRMSICILEKGINDCLLSVPSFSLSQIQVVKEMKYSEGNSGFHIPWPRCNQGMPRMEHCWKYMLVLLGWFHTRETKKNVGQQKEYIYFVLFGIKYIQIFIKPEKIKQKLLYIFFLLKCVGFSRHLIPIELLTVPLSRLVYIIY